MMSTTLSSRGLTAVRPHRTLPWVLLSALLAVALGGIGSSQPARSATAEAQSLGLETFTLPAPNPGQGIYYGDLQAAFPGVDWGTLDRLYLPAGHWSALLLGNLPQRTAQHPLVITNLGGQVKIGGLGAGSHAILMTGGSNWVLTGRWDASAQTGDLAFPGHAGGYAHSAGTYGIFVDDAFESTGDSGLAVTGGATDFEIEFVEITRVGFAGALIKTDDDGDAHMSRVRFHDNYIHDTGSEGLYFGSTQSPPQHQLPALELYNNRIVRSGTELVQLGQIGRDSEIHHNVFFLGALDWKNPFANFQDNAGQFGVREGDVSIHHNLFIGGASSFFQFFPQPRAGDTHLPGDTVAFHDNYFSHGRNFGIYVHAQSDQITEFLFTDNWFRALNFQYDEIDSGATDPDTVVLTFNQQSPMQFVDNRWTDTTVFLNASTPNIQESGSEYLASIPPVVFMDSGFPPDFDYHRVEVWTELDRNDDPVVYEVGDYVLNHDVPGGGTLYRCLQAHTGREPWNHPTYWAVEAAPADDLRLHPASPFQGFGLLDGAQGIFSDGFESGTTELWSQSQP